MAQDKASAVTVTEGSLRGNVLFVVWMKLHTGDEMHVELLCRRQCLTRVVQPLIVSRGNSLVEIEVGGISGCRMLVKSVRDQPQVLHRTEHPAHKTIVVACSQALMKACFKRLSRAEFRHIVWRQVAKLGEFGARLAAHVDVYVSQVITVLVSVAIAVGKG